MQDAIKMKAGGNRAAGFVVFMQFLRTNTRHKYKADYKGDTLCNAES